jgi:hypothetical protein
VEADGEVGRPGVQLLKLTKGFMAIQNMFFDSDVYSSNAKNVYLSINASNYLLTLYRKEASTRKPMVNLAWRRMAGHMMVE